MALRGTKRWVRRTEVPVHQRLGSRYGRVLSLATAGTVSAVSMIGVLGLIQTSEPGAKAASATPHTPARVVPATTGPTVALAVSTQRRNLRLPRTSPSETGTALPRESGSGRRVVFDQSAQRVWLVDAGGDIRRSYPVSGSVLDNLRPGTYSVYSRSRHAVGIDDSGTMEYFVRFTRGVNAAIGFHTIPQLNGRPLQDEDQLGTPTSHGCIRQRTPDAIALWEFAPLGTKVTVVA